MSLLYLGVLVLCSLALSRADTPANCTFDDVQGTWVFYEGPRGNGPNIACDSINLGTLNHTTIVKLMFPNVAVDQNGHKGTWTMIYNQGFEVIINNRRYFAFSNYTKVEGHVVSYCHQTLPGWSHDIFIRDWACYIGHKSTVGLGVTQGKPDTLFKRDIDEVIEELKNTPFQQNPDMVKEINSKQSDWTATSYPFWQGLSQHEILQRMGGIKSRVAQRPRKLSSKEIEFKTAYLKKAIQQLPKQFDWRNVNGQNFVSPIRNQGNCGSCYAFASMAQLEARYRILTNNTGPQPVFSPMDIVQCSEYSQGCDGGFPYLIAGKYGMDFGVSLEKCNPYNGHFNDQCDTDPKCRKYYTREYKYVGGYYGAGDDELMQLALVNNGPIAVGFEVYNDFMTYKAGVYHHTFVPDNVNKMKERMFGVPDDHWNPFHLTNHAVLVVGYGTDETSGQDYWIVKNSWGTSWGLNGYFWIRRGNDECGIESMAVEANPIITY